MMSTSSNSTVSMSLKLLPDQAGGSGKFMYTSVAQLQAMHSLNVARASPPYTHVNQQLLHNIRVVTMMSRLERFLKASLLQMAKTLSKRSSMATQLYCGVTALSTIQSPCPEQISTFTGCFL
jgi:hypothetical protein